MGSETEVRRDRGPLIGGVVFILVGIFLLLEKLGYAPEGFVLHFWPTIFIVIGLMKLVYDGGRFTGAVLIGVGILLQLSQVGLLRVQFWQLWPVLIIIAGIGMLWQAFGREAFPATSDPQFDAFYIFGGGDRQVNTKNFKGARLMAMFGGYKLDLTRADMEGNEVVVEANAVFGGGEIRVPESWLVVMKGMGVFGAYEDKTRHFQPDPAKPTKTLIVKGTVMFGGIEVKN